MVTVHIEGLQVCVFNSTDNVLRVCMLNSGLEETLEIPHHLQTLAMRRDTFGAVTRLPLPSVKGRLSASRPFRDRMHVGWDLSGLTVKINGGTGLPRKHQPTLALEHPDPDAPDWRPLHWVLPFERYMPGCTFPASAQKVGEESSAIAEITGAGAMCVGTAPTTLGGDANFVWRFNNDVQQAVTDTMDVEFQTPPAITLHDARGTEVGSIQATDGADIWLINEATDRDLKIEKRAFPLPGGHARHLEAFFEVIKDEQNVALPIRGRRWRTPIVEGTFCIVGRMDIP